MKKLITLLLFTLSLPLFGESILQGNIIITPQNDDSSSKIRPGTYVALSVEIENVGRDTSSDGTIFIRFAFPNTGPNRNPGELFRTEQKAFPKLQPGEKVLITFSEQHRWPTIEEFIRSNWGRRQYQARATIGEVSHTLSSAAIGYDVHYYPGSKHQLIKQFPE